MAWYCEIPFRADQVNFDYSFFKLQPRGKYENILKGENYSPAEFPVEMQILTKHKTLPCFMRVAWYVYAVCQGFRDAVEALEPGVHRFFPVALRLRSGELSQQRYFFLNIHHQFDAVLVRHSDWNWRWDAGRKMLPRERKKFLPPMGTRLGLSRPEIAGRHLWTGKVMLRSFFFMSDAVYERVKGCRPLGLQVQHCEEYDEPWVESENVDFGDEGQGLS